MKPKIYHLVLGLMVLYLTPLTVKAQHQAEHALEVARLSQWAPEYLTVINNWDNRCISPELPSLKCMSVITKVNGEDTSYMDESDFYRIIDTGQPFTLTYLTKRNGENKEYTQVITPRKGKLMISKTQGTISPRVTLMSDNDVDFFKFNTFDYAVAGDDPLTDKTYLEIFAKSLLAKGLKRSDDPDIVLYLTKDVNQKIESMYVPKYVTTTNTGSTSAGVDLGRLVGLKGVNVGGASGSATTTTADVGDMRTNVSADVYLEVAVLDASKLNSDIPPVIWKLVYDVHATHEIRLLDEVKRYIGSYMHNYPFHEPVFASEAYTWNVFCDDFAKTAIITDIVPGTSAESLGCQVGDQIKYVRYNNKLEGTCIYRPGQPFYKSVIIPTTQMQQVGKKKFAKGGLTEKINYSYINITDN